MQAAGALDARIRATGCTFAEAFEALLSPRGPMILIRRGEAPSAAGPAATEKHVDPGQHESETRSRDAPAPPSASTDGWRVAI